MTAVKKGDLTEIKSLANPPQLVKDVLSATMTLLQEENVEDFRYVKRFLADPSSLKRLEEVDVSVIPPELVVKARGYIDGFTEDKVRSVSAATTSFFRWVNDVLSKAGSGAGDLSKPGNSS
ncbi:dynein axonemal heavy chain 6-like [Ylistrum balloti]|uniref:dynein axonemal heavy chain 6-like n=1 Tax=Ylistrum balloti TaxID=509963 RepID=UPI002905EF4D|nr:dynein axonemal heavy chain 6-like [Ylistrum balloti]